MTTSFKPMCVRFDSDSFHVDLSDGRVIDVPLEQNQSPCILMNFVEGRRSLALAST